MPSASLHEAFKNLEPGLRSHQSHGSSSTLPHWSRSGTGGCYYIQWAFLEGMEGIELVPKGCLHGGKQVRFCNPA